MVGAAGFAYSVDMPPFDHRTTERHYETLLAPIYGWMIGDVVSARAAADDDLRRLGVPASGAGRRALDLGAGIGVHAVPLATRGYEVTAIDTSTELLAQLARDSSRISTVRGDIVAVSELVRGPFDVVVCMGDTLTHLATFDAVRALVIAVRSLLADDGLFVVEFRDYTQAREGTDRIVAVRGDDERLLTCLLEWEPTRVRVTDIVHERSDAGWRMRASEYAKLRLSLRQVDELLGSHGCQVLRAETTPRFVRVVARARRAG